jgi:hypothetical protein
MQLGGTNEQRPQQYGNMAIRAITWSSNLGTVAALSSTHICWVKLKFVALVATQTQETGASQRLVRCKGSCLNVAAEVVAVRSPNVCARPKPSWQWLDATPRRRGQLPPPQIARTGGYGCLDETRGWLSSRHSVPDFINDTCGRSAG